MMLLPALFNTTIAKAIKLPHVGKRVVGLDSILTKASLRFFFSFLPLVLFCPSYLSVSLPLARADRKNDQQARRWITGHNEE